jgi:hypothetical protein
MFQYFSEASVVSMLLQFSINRMNDKKLVSNPSHMPNQESEETEVKIPLVNVKNKWISLELSVNREKCIYSTYISFLFHNTVMHFSVCGA